MARLTELEWTPAEFIRAKRYTTSSFYHWMTGERTPSFPRLKRLARDLDVSLCWLLLGEDGVREVSRRRR